MKYFFTFFLLLPLLNLQGMNSTHTLKTAQSKLSESSITSPLEPYFPKVLQILIAQYATEWQLRDTFSQYAGRDSFTCDSAIAFSEDENFVTTARYTRDLKTSESREIIASQNIQTQQITDDYSSYPGYERVTVSPTGKYFAHISFDKQQNWTCKIIDRLTKTTSHVTLPVTTSQAVESRYLFENKYFFFSIRGAITVFDQQTKTLNTWQTPEYYADQLICSPNGKYLFAHVIDFTFRARYFLILDVTNRNQIACIQDHSGCSSGLVATFSPDSSTLTIAGTDLAFYHIAHKQDSCQTSYLSAITRQELAERIAIKCLCYSHDGAFIALGTRNHIIILHRDQDDKFRTCQIIQIHKWDKLDAIMQISFSRSGKYLVSGHSGDHVMKLWENHAVSLVEKEQKK